MAASWPRTLRRGPLAGRTFGSRAEYRRALYGGETDYRARIARGTERNLSRSVAAGKPRRGEQSITERSRMRFVSGGQVVNVPVRSKAQRSMIGRYNRMTQLALAPGQGHRLRPFAGKKVGGFELEADVDVLADMDLRGELDFEPYSDEVAA